MADQGIKKVTILKGSLPSLSADNNEYIVRYRIITEDKNRTSHWSPKYRLKAANVTDVTIPNSLSYDPNLGTITLVWTPPTGAKPEFDIYANWSGTGWQYITTVASTIYATVIPSGATSVRFAVQSPTYPKLRSVPATFFETSQTDF